LAIEEHTVPRLGEQGAGGLDLLRGHRRRPAEPHTAGSRGGEAFVGALDDEFADELGCCSLAALSDIGNW
jgi:hypothetical protein